MKLSQLAPLALCALALIGCSDTDSNAPGSDAAIQNVPTEKDPTPETGTGGASQTTSPDTTTNGAPGANEQKPAP